MNPRDVVLFGLYAFIGVLVFVTRLLTLPLEATALVALIAAVSVPTAHRVEDIYKRRRDRQAHRKRISELVSRVNDRVTEIGLEITEQDEIIDTLADDDEEPTLETVYENYIREHFEELPDYQQEILLILLLSRKVDSSSQPIEQARLKTQIASLLSNFNLGSLDKQTIELLGAYDQIEYGKIEQAEVTALFGREPENPRDSALEFATDYGTTDQLAIVLFNDRERSTELRKTLGRLIARGKIDTETVNRETAERIKDEMENIGDGATKYLVFSRRMHYDDAFEDAIDRFPHLRIGTKYPENGFPDAAEYMRVYMIYPEHDYGSADRFLEEALKPMVSEEILEEHPDAFVAAMPLELSRLSIYPEHENVDEHLSGTHEALMFLKTGASEDLSEVVSDRVVSDVGISELLAVLPFNVITPDINEHEKELIIENYNQLQDRFGVSELFDWADIDPESLADALAEIESDVEDERWEELAETIVERAEKYSTATHGEDSSSISP